MSTQISSRKNFIDHICQGYHPGCIGDIVSLHARHYSRSSGFGAFFERQVATGLTEFTADLPRRNKALWLYMEHGRTLASVAIDGDAVAGTAHLRWFIVDDTLRGSGLGRYLLTEALRFADLHFETTCLWTFKGLDAARHLYESMGFVLTDEMEGMQWGTPVMEQRFSRSRR